MASWQATQADLSQIARTQLFFVGGAPRSGTTWLQRILDAHPEICCRGEGLFLNHLANPLGALVDKRREVLAAKNSTLFEHTGGFGLPTAEDTEHLAATAILLALHRQAGGKPYRAIGEKTPENVFFFDRLKAMFPTARFIGIARDPRDVLTSAWHFFRRGTQAADAAAEKTDFVTIALPSLVSGTRALLELPQRYPGDCVLLTYEGLRRNPAPIVTALFRLLGVACDLQTVLGCLEATSFEASTGGRSPGDALDGSFFRKGVSRDWHATLTPAMVSRIDEALGWSYPAFGWEP